MNDDDRSKSIEDWRHLWARAVGELDEQDDTNNSLAIMADTICNVTNTLDTRETTHGRYADNCQVTQKLEEVIHAWSHNAGQGTLSNMDYETLHMIFHKIARACNGDPNFKDHWHDIAGYATLREKACGDS